MIWTVLNAFARLLPGYPWGLFPAFTSRELQPHLQLALFLALILMELNKSSLALERAQQEMRDIDLRLREVEAELREAKKRLFEAIRAQVELRKLKRHTGTQARRDGVEVQDRLLAQDGRGRVHRQPQEEEAHRLNGIRACVLSTYGLHFEPGLSHRRGARSHQEYLMKYCLSTTPSDVFAALTTLTTTTNAPTGKPSLGTTADVTIAALLCSDAVKYFCGQRTYDAFPLPTPTRTTGALSLCCIGFAT